MARLTDHLWRTAGGVIILLPFFAAWYWGGDSAEFWLLLGQAWVAAWWSLANWLNRQ